MPRKQVLDSTEAFEQLLAGPQEEHYILRLYITGMTPQSVRAIANVKKICEEHLQGRYELEVVDLYQQPQLAKGEQIIAAPTLIKKLPHPLGQVLNSQQIRLKVCVMLTSFTQMYG